MASAVSTIVVKTNKKTAAEHRAIIETLNDRLQNDYPDAAVLVVPDGIDIEADGVTLTPSNIRTNFRK